MDANKIKEIISEHIEEIVTEYIEKIVGDYIGSFIGDTPVYEQLGMALETKSDRYHIHDQYALQKEVDSLKNDVEALMYLVGDSPVAEQIASALL